ncbi:sugar phosphate isomerase/epimerase family protein [Sagittula sp. SSi028]|uniref:sugar phosphate isomerase/epimerase family protein n=1 Tax=Sagittula sp. SSi028 TaxID=3400636 RepID=UPI003AF5FFE7
MQLTLETDSLAHLPLPHVLDAAQRLNLAGLELNTGGQSASPHINVDLMLRDAGARRGFLADVAARDLRIFGLNAFGNPLHPVDRKPADDLVATLRLAGEMGVDTVIAASGLPAANTTDETPNWVTNSWTPESKAILRYQWEDVLFPFWTAIGALAKECGVRRIALTLGPNQCVHNVPTLMALRDTIGPQIGANLVPAHQILLGADPIRGVEVLGDALYNVQATDVLLNPTVQSLSSLIDTGDVMEVADRAWSITTPGYGHERHWWARFFYRLAMIDYDGGISVTHLDQVLSPLDSVQKSAEFLRPILSGAG